MNPIAQIESTFGSSADEVIRLITTYGMNIIGAVLILIIGWTVSGYAKRLVLKGMRKAKFDETLGQFLANLLKYGVLAFTAIAVLSKFGVQTASLIAVLGAAGLAIGLSLQGSLSHVASGVMLLFFRPFKIGDFVQSGSYMGTVEEIGLFTTTINSIENLKVVVPNSQWWGDAIINYSTNTTRRVDMEMGISYSDNMDLAIKTLLAVLKKDNRIRTTPAEPFVVVDNLGDSSVNLKIRYWCKSSDVFDLKWDLTKAFKEALDKEGISIPFPQRDLNIVYDVKAVKGNTKAA